MYVPQDQPQYQILCKPTQSLLPKIYTCTSRQTDMTKNLTCPHAWEINTYLCTIILPYASVTGKPILPVKLYTGYDLVYEIIANPYPGYSLTMVYVCQIMCWVQFGYDLCKPKRTLGNFWYWVWFAVYTGCSENVCSVGQQALAVMPRYSACIVTFGIHISHPTCGSRRMTS